MISNCLRYQHVLFTERGEETGWYLLVCLAIIFMINMPRNAEPTSYLLVSTFVILFTIMLGYNHKLRIRKPIFYEWGVDYSDEAGRLASRCTSAPVPLTLNLNPRAGIKRESGTARRRQNGYLPLVVLEYPNNKRRPGSRISLSYLLLSYKTGSYLALCQPCFFGWINVPNNYRYT